MLTALREQPIKHIIRGLDEAAEVMPMASKVGYGTHWGPSLEQHGSDSLLTAINRMRTTAGQQRAAGNNSVADALDSSATQMEQTRHNLYWDKNPDGTPVRQGVPSDADVEVALGEVDSVRAQLTSVQASVDGASPMTSFGKWGLTLGTAGVAGSAAIVGWPYVAPYITAGE